MEWMARLMTIMWPTQGQCLNSTKSHACRESRIYQRECNWKKYFRSAIQQEQRRHKFERRWVRYIVTLASAYQIFEPARVTIMRKTRFVGFKRTIWNIWTLKLGKQMISYRESASEIPHSILSFLFSGTLFTLIVEDTSGRGVPSWFLNISRC